MACRAETSRHRQTAHCMKNKPEPTLISIAVQIAHGLLMDRPRRRKLLFACTLAMLVYVAVGVYFRDPMSGHPLFFIAYWMLAMAGLVVVVLLALYDMLRAIAETRAEIRKHLQQSLDEVNKARLKQQAKDETDRNDR